MVRGDFIFVWETIISRPVDISSVVKFSTILSKNRYIVIFADIIKNIVDIADKVNCHHFAIDYIKKNCIKSNGCILQKEPGQVGAGINLLFL